MKSHKNTFIHTYKYLPHLPPIHTLALSLSQCSVQRLLKAVGEPVVDEPLNNSHGQAWNSFLFFLWLFFCLLYSCSNIPLRVMFYLLIFTFSIFWKFVLIHSFFCFLYFCIFLLFVLTKFLLKNVWTIFFVKNTVSNSAVSYCRLHNDQVRVFFLFEVFLPHTRSEMIPSISFCFWREEIQWVRLFFCWHIVKFSLSLVVCNGDYICYDMSLYSQKEWKALALSCQFYFFQ